MRITGLRLIGFKSFVDPSDVLIEPGLTGIVGPNGCGKSNLVEALRFVMGESSYKAMRGGAMDDVIFSGAGQRPARNSAEVVLFASRHTGSGGEALEIARRIEREAGSAYRINGREARARDVQILFADAATGARSSALVRQGQIAELIAAKPAQRRAILEDAAGISGVEGRRREAELKLNATAQNLERLDDVMSEVRAMWEAMRRQVRQAARYRNLSAEIRKGEALLMLARWRAAEERLAEAEAALAAATSALAAAAAAEAAAAREEAEAGRSLPGLRQAAAETGAGLQRLRLKAEELEREAGQLAARRAELDERAGEAQGDLAREREIGEEAGAALARLAEEEAGLLAESQGAEERIAAARSEAAEREAALTRCESELAEIAAALAALAAEREALNRAAREAEGKRDRLARERQALAAEEAGIAAAEAEDGALEEARAQSEAALAELAAADAALRDTEARLAEARQREEAARGPREAAERALAALETEARTLAALLKSADRGAFPPLLDAIDVEAGFESALAAALGEDLEASLDEAAPRAWSIPGPGEGDPPLPEGAEPLARHVRAPQPLHRRLGQIGLVAAEDGLHLQARLRPGQRLVSREGDLWRWDGLRAVAGAPTLARQALEQRARLAALERDMETARAALDEARRAHDLARDERAAAEAAQAAARRASSELRALADRRREALAEAERRAARLAERLSALHAALARIDAEAAEAQAAREKATAALGRLSSAAVLEERRAEARERLEAARGAAHEARAAAERLAQAEAARAARIDAIAAERRRWQAGAERSEARIAELERRLATLDAERRRLAEEPASLEDRRARLADAIATAEAAEREAGDRLAAAEAEHRRLAQAARAAAEALSEAREAKAREEERLAAAAQRRGEVEAQVAEAFGRKPEALAELAGHAPGAPLPDPIALDSRIERLKGERERLGPVNLRAEQEAEELARRLDSLGEERADLEGAVKRLRQAIQTLNREARDRLLAAFGDVDRHFQALFQTLFDGGTAELMLTEADDPLEAGLEIMARPPGKRLQSMTLLSGGEQALTALALILAVFLTNPSPICVLDEVDAALDDANVERFCDLLDDVRRRTDTRFLVVTHNPITMARMDRLFGVTMAERGVSQIVSVELEEAEAYRQVG